MLDSACSASSVFVNDAVDSGKMVALTAVFSRISNVDRLKNCSKCGDGGRIHGKEKGECAQKCKNVWN